MLLSRQISRLSLKGRTLKKLFSNTATEKNGLVLCVYKDGDKLKPTPATAAFDNTIGGKLSHLFSAAGVRGKLGAPRLFYGLSDRYPCVAVVGLGDVSDQQLCTEEHLHRGRHHLRIAVANGVRALREVCCSHVTVEPGEHADASAEGAHLALWRYDELKKRADDEQPSVRLSCTEDCELWRRGEVLAAGQNLARTLMEAPASHVTPTTFCQRVAAALSDLPVGVVERDQAWMTKQRMGAFLSVTRGSAEPPRLLELSYTGADAQQPPLAIVGKGVTFDSGGISLKPARAMERMRADMGGAACAAGALYTAARLRLPANLRAVIPLCENMPGGRATRPADVVTAANGTTIQVDNTDAEGRLILADALWWAAQSCQPRAILDMATLTGAMAVALGGAAAGVFTNSTAGWQQLRAAGAHSGDRLWRMPLWQHYSDIMRESRLADLNNVAGSIDAGGGACTAAAFLKEFVPAGTPWFHVDIAGVMEAEGAGAAAALPYLGRGMSGRPTRAVVQFAEALFAA